MVRRGLGHPSPVAPSSDRILTNQIILTPDGTKLVADLYVPWGTPPFPAVVEITPYGSQQLSRLGEIYASRGFLFLAVDARGRYRSAGTFEPLTYDQIDGQAVIRWLVEHKLCNKVIGTRGHSYSGYNQLLAAIDGPPELKAMVVGVAPADPFENVPFQGGAYDLNDLFWLLSLTGRVCSNGDGDGDGDGEDYDYEDYDYNKERLSQEKQMENSQRTKELDHLLDMAMISRPFRDIDLRLGLWHDTFREWISHWQFDDFWRARSVGHRLERTSVPTLHISGWWDGNGLGSTRFYRGMRERAATDKARVSQRLLIGPWNHYLQAPDGDDLPLEEKNMILRAALRDSLNDELAWFDKHLLGIKPGPATSSRVTLYLTGIHQWINLSDWPPLESKQVNYYLAILREGEYGSLKTFALAEGKPESSYIFNPEDPTPFADNEVDGERMPFDNAEVERSRKDMLIFDTDRVGEPLTLIGHLSLIIYAQADVTDFDLCAKLLDLYPDGRAIFLADGIIRARFRQGWDRPELVRPGEINEYTIDLWHIGHVIRKEHALRLEVSGGAFLRFDINPCTGGNLADETKSRTAKVTILHSQGYPSRLILPIYHDAKS